MKATEARLFDFLKKSPQFVIPIYQRNYSWTLAQCQQLWDDIIRAGQREDIPAHFIGSVVYIEQGLYQVSSQSALLVIDGQQRLTTATLIIEALCRHLGDSEPLEGFSARKLRHYYLLNDLEAGERAFKLLLTQTDKESLLALLRQKSWPENYSLRLKENFDFFDEQLGKYPENLLFVCKGLAKLLIVDVALSRGQDNPQLIFESMNSTGKALSQADLIRNFILMGLEPEHQTRLYEDYWRPMEVAFGQEGYNAQFDSFMRHYLTVKTGNIPRIDDVYEAFKAYALEPKNHNSGVDQLVADIQIYAGYYCAMALNRESDKQLALGFKDLRELKVDVAYPFLLELYHDYQHNHFSVTDFVSAIRLIESYVFRRAVCAIPTNSLNKTFATIKKSLNKKSYLESIQAYLQALPSYRRFPDDEEFKREIQKRDLYNFRNRSYWLRRLENEGRKERVAVDEYTIEHILPQQTPLPTAWQEALGSNWKQIQETYLHTLGNLTLTGYNSEYSNRIFADKCNMKGGFKESPLRLNKGLGSLNHWNEQGIIGRAQMLAQTAVDVWQAPKLPSGILVGYAEKKTRNTAWSLNDHPHLSSNAPMRAVFDAFRQQVLEIDAGVTEEFTKLYVVYKAETNFVDVVPQKSRLRLSIYMPFYELSDPKGLAKDVTHLGRWGNGNVEVGLSSLDQLPYVMGLIRQAFERQMGEEN
ncbi:DUF262 domain-containing protein [Buttiauxella selenatireducens]|uniref:DUF262 domain-containing protein n=1 Tax=Buttiauxella selenatireducens TaxID=3073902 RepID=A0ABY9SDC1_9ENTR|nr:DUF262 domain-containing protein [Buttiauxella sp. R73]WMY74895.1 DUF262 domain-containing protein [Buttiauxella sp. R73]